MKKMLTLLFVLLMMAMLSCAVAEDEPTLYECGDFYYILLEDGTAEISHVKLSSNHVTVPAELDGHIVTSIGTYAFEYHTDLLTVTLPDSITSIGYMAFSECFSLFSVKLPDGLLSIGDKAFFSCSALSSIDLPDRVISIGDHAFTCCDSLTLIRLPASVTTVEKNTFDQQLIHVSPDNPVLTSIDGVLFNKVTKELIYYPRSKTAANYRIPQGIKSIGVSAFSNHPYLTSVTIPDSVTQIREEAFGSCSALSSIILPDSIVSIEDYAFACCYSLASINLPQSITYIGFEAFYYCDRLISITVTPGSYAEQYCKTRELPYTYPDANDWLFN